VDGLEEIVAALTQALFSRGYTWEYREGNVRHLSKDDFARAKIIVDELWIGYASDDMECFIKVAPDASIEKAEARVARMVNEVNKE
jgi:hypothetical protein